LQAGAAGQIYYIENVNPVFAPQASGLPEEKSTLHQYDLNKRKDDVFLSGVSGYIISFDKKKLLYNSRTTYAIVGTAAKPQQPGQGRLNVDAIEMHIDPRAEWTQIFNEAWRINRDYF